jgi:hypothetical protein
MLDLLKIVYNACDPFLAATPHQWVNCNEGRGGDVLAHRFCSELRKANRSVRFLLSGHFGSGKSSELIHLDALLQEKSHHLGGKRYFPVYLDADEYIDRNDADLIELLLAIVAEMGDLFRSKLNIHLDEPYLKQKLEEIKEYFGAEVEANELEVSLWAVKTKVKRLASDRAVRAEVRKKLNKQEGPIVDSLNIVFDKARLALKTKGYDDFVLILDNLEKIRRTKAMDDEEKSLYEFFIDNAALLRRFTAHIIYTVPLRLVTQKAGELKEQYGLAPFVMPMIKVVERDRVTRYEEGYVVMRKLLQRHITGYHMTQEDYDPQQKAITVEEVIDGDALNLLIRYSGGSARELMRYIREATSETDTAPISRDAARAALRSTIDLYSRSIQQEHWEKLAELELTPDQQIANGDSDYRELLTQVAIMEYRNGAKIMPSSNDPDDLDASLHDEPWYGVHPIVRTLSRFKNAVQALRTEREIARGQAQNGPTANTV